MSRLDVKILHRSKLIHIEEHKIWDNGRIETVLLFVYYNVMTERSTLHIIVSCPSIFGGDWEIDGTALAPCY